MGNSIITRVDKEKDLEIVMQNNLSPEKHINKIIGETYNMLRNIRVAFHYMDKEMMKKIIIIMVRPKMEYAAIVWSPHKKNI